MPCRLHPAPAVGALLLFLAFALALPLTASAQFVEGRYWVTNGVVHAILPTDDTIYIAGDFTHVGPAVGGAVSLDSVDGEARFPLPLVAGTVLTVATDGSGGWYVGGDFHTVQSQVRNNVAHFDASGHLTAWNPNVEGKVHALVRVGSTVYLGGEFGKVGGQTRPYLAAVDASTGTLLPWFASLNGSVLTLATTGFSALYAGGTFTSSAGTPRNGVAAFDLQTGSMLSFNPNANGTVHTLWVRATADASSRVYIGGEFTTLGGQPRANLGACDLFGNVLAWNPGANGVVRVIRATGGIFPTHTVYVGGSFSSIGGQARSHVASLGSGTGAANAWAPHADGPVRAIMSIGSSIYVAGEFTSIGGATRHHLAALDGTAAATSWDPRANAPVYALAWLGTQVLAGGRMSSVGGVERNRLAALDRMTGAATSWSPDADGTVHTMARWEETIVLGGSFSFIDGLARSRLAAVDRTTGQNTTFNPVVNGPVFALATHGNTLLVGGNFTVTGGSLRNNIAAFDMPTGALGAWNPNADGTVYVLSLRTRTTAPFTTTVFAGGLFNAIGAGARSRVAELSLTTGAATAWAPPAFDNSGHFVGSIVANDQFVYLGGVFYSIGSQPRAGLAALYGDTGQLSGWNANTEFPCQVYALAHAGADLFVGGYFSQLGGQQRAGLGAVNPFSASVTEWYAAPSDEGTPTVVFFPTSISTLAVDGMSVFVGGDFSAIAGAPHSGFAVLSQTPVAVEETAVHGTRIVMASTPNPFARQVTLRFRLPADAVTSVSVFDVAGRLVRRFPPREHASGEHHLVWDGRDDTGRDVAAGVYFARVRTPLGHAGHKLLLVR